MVNNPLIRTYFLGVVGIGWVDFQGKATQQCNCFSSQYTQIENFGWQTFPLEPNQKRFWFVHMDDWKLEMIVFED